MKQAFRLLASACAITFAASAAAAAEAPFEITVRLEREISVVQLTSTANQVVLTGFNVNRGNCKTKLGGIYPLPLTFKFGDGVKLFAYPCKVKEVAVVTDQGTFTYSFGS